MSVSVTLHRVLCAESAVTPAWLYRPAAEGRPLRAVGIGVPSADWIPFPVAASLVKHPTHGPLLIDCGLSMGATDNLTADFGRFNAFFWRRLETGPGRSLASQLRALGLRPEDIELAVMTHLHVDHASGMADLPRATFVCSSEEWAASQVRLGVFQGYRRRRLPDFEQILRIDFGSQGAPYGPFEKTLDLFGDGSVRLLSTPGHTLGHLSVLLQLAERQALVIGDAVFTLRNLREDLQPFRTVDDAAYERSIEQIRAFTEQNPDVLLLPAHDEQAWREAAGLAA
jgi:N-acyl homoserine lactone hydrolase